MLRQDTCVTRPILEDGNLPALVRDVRTVEVTLANSRFLAADRPELKRGTLQFVRFAW
jgi:hypothetical protein